MAVFSNLQQITGPYLAEISDNFEAVLFSSSALAAAASDCDLVVLFDVVRGNVLMK